MTDLTGKTLGKYRLVERLGRGGMAEVYKAYQPGLDRYVAIKLMHSYLSDDPDFVGRFRREARAVAALRHQHIVQVYDFDVQDDIYYMVQEYIPGGTLKSRLRQANERGETIPIEETVRIFKAICSAVDYAHSRGRIHRDIKPDNIMFDADGRPVLTDFGIATIVGGTRFTATGAMIGTPAYMSPEQGKGEPGDERSDIYSLGVVLYEMVTGSVPFDADTPFAVVLKHVNEPLPLPRMLNPDVPYGVERVILKAMAKDPQDRYQIAGDLARDLERAVQDAQLLPLDTSEVMPPPPVEGTSAPTTEPIPAQVPSTDIEPAPEVEPPPPAGKPRWVWAAAGVAVLVLIACLCGGFGFLRQRKRLIITRVTYHPTAEGGELGGDVGVLIESGEKALGKECDGDVDRALAFFEQAIAKDGSVARAYLGRGRCYMCSGENEKAMPDLDRALELDPELAEAYLWRGRLWIAEEEEDKAWEDLSQAIELAPRSPDAYYWRALLSIWTTDDWEQALSDLDKTIEIAPNFAEAYLYRGRVHLWRDEKDAAMADLDKFVAMKPDVPDGYYELGELYKSNGEYEKALAEYTKAIELAPDESSAYVARAMVNLKLDNPSAAVQDYTKALDISADPLLYLWRGIAYYAAGQYEEALKDMRQAAQDREYRCAAAYGEGLACYAAGLYQEAVDAYDRALECDWDEYSYEFEVLGDSHVLMDRARAYRAEGEYESSLDDLDQLIEQYDDWFLPYFERALTYEAMKEHKQALADLRRALKLVDDSEWRKIIERKLGEMTR